MNLLRAVTLCEEHIKQIKDDLLRHNFKNNLERNKAKSDLECYQLLLDLATDEIVNIHK